GRLGPLGGVVAALFRGLEAGAHDHLGVRVRPGVDRGEAARLGLRAARERAEDVRRAVVERALVERAAARVSRADPALRHELGVAVDELAEAAVAGEVL